MSRRVRNDNRPTPIPKGYASLTPDFIRAVHDWAVSMDNTGQFAQVDLGAHLRAFPECRAFNCGTYTDHEFARKVLGVCVLFGVGAFALISGWMGTAALIILTGVGVGVYRHKLGEVNRIHAEQRSDPRVQQDELNHVRQFVEAMFVQFATHLKGCAGQREHLIDVLRHGGEPEKSADVKTVRALENAVLRKLHQAEAQTQHMSHQGELYQAYMDVVRWYTEWHRLFVVAAREADKGLIRHANVQQPLAELGRLMEEADQEQKRSDRHTDRRAGLRAVASSIGR